MIKNPLIRAMTVAGFSAGMLISATVNAAHTVSNMPAIVGYTFSDIDNGLTPKDGFPLTRSDWVSNPTAYSWNPVNAREGKHPDRDDGVVYIFKNAADAGAWWDGVTGEPPVGVPDKAVAYVHWALDNESGMFPGIMAMTDDTLFQNNNCIMSSGLAILDDSNPDDIKAVKKTCDNPPASAKRFKLVILQADEYIDIVFNMTNKDLTYIEYDGAADPNGDVTGDIFRNYRYLMKVGNGTGTDTVSGARTGTRLAGIKVELGFDIDTAFTRTDGLETGDGLLYETDQCVEKRYWDIAWDHDIGATDYCDAQWREVFLPHEFATISPGMYAEVDDARNPDAGYWDVNPAGLVLPALPKPGIVPTSPLIKPQVIESGDITDNYFDVAANQAAGSNPPVSGNVFGHLMPYGVFADGDPEAIPMGIYKDDDGDPATEGSLYAWWDGSSTTCCYRWGIDGSNSDDHGAIGPDAWGIVSDTELTAMMDRPLSKDEVLDPPRYEVGYMDDLGGLNVDTFIKITPDYVVATNKTFTVRLTAQSVAAGAPGTADGPWVANPADASAFEPDPVAPVTPPTTSDGGGSSGFGLGWITAGLLALGLLFRRKRFQ